LEKRAPGDKETGAGRGIIDNTRPVNRQTNDDSWLK